MELNIVTCGICGKVFGHKLNHEEELTCPYCSTKSDICDFPDYFYPPEYKNSIINIEETKSKTQAQTEVETQIYLKGYREGFDSALKVAWAHAELLLIAVENTCKNHVREYIKKLKS